MKFSHIAEFHSFSKAKRDVLRFFTRHPHKNGKTYLGHLVHAWHLSLEMARGSVALLVHGVFPAWFEHTGSNIISSLYRTTSLMDTQDTQDTIESHESSESHSLDKQA